MLRRVAWVIATSLLIATSFVQTAHADGTTLFANVRVWPLVETVSPDPMYPNDTPNLIGMNPTESADDSNGATGHVATYGAMATVVTLMKNMIHSADGNLVGLIFWNPSTNNFKWYGVVDTGSAAGLDVNRSAPQLTGLQPTNPACNPLKDANGNPLPPPTFQQGDVWAAVAGATDIAVTSLFVNFKGTDNFRKYQVVGSAGPLPDVNDVKVDQRTGLVYFTGESSGTINQLDPRTDAVKTWVVSGVPHYLTIDPDGRVYATVANATIASATMTSPAVLADAIIRVDPNAAANAQVTAWPLPTLTGNFQPLPLSSLGILDIADGIDLDGNGLVWFVESQSKRVGRLDPSITYPTVMNPNLTEFTKLQVQDPQQIAASGQGSGLQVFFTEGDGEAVSIVTPQHNGVPVPPKTLITATPPTTVLTCDETHRPMTATIKPIVVPIPATDPEITRFFPMPVPPTVRVPPGTDKSQLCMVEQCHPAGLTDVAQGGVYGNYLDPLMNGTSAVFRVVVNPVQEAKDDRDEEEGPKLTGGGRIQVPSSGNNNKATFGFVVKRTSTGTTKGQLDFKNYATGDKVHSEQITSLSITLNSATFTGTGRNASGNRCYFRVTVQDISKDGKADTFKIEGDALNPLPPCASAGPATLSNGNIVINNS